MKQVVTVQQSRKRKPKLKKREHCPMCGAQELLTLAPDQFCTKCDWDTCAEYVEMGLMNNLEVAAKDHFCRDKEKRGQRKTDEVQPPQMPKSA